MRGEVVFADDVLDAWIAGFTELSRGPSDKMRAEWQAESEMMFADSQSFVHVRTGLLKGGSDGLDDARYEAPPPSITVDGDGDELSFLIEYPAPYAIYEHGRGGDHAFLTLAFARTDFPRALERGFSRTVAGWR